jgi:hypothetical protein
VQKTLFCLLPERFRAYFFCARFQELIRLLEGERCMRRTFVLLAIVFFVCGAVAQQGEGLSPKAGALSGDLYTNVYFGFNLKVPAKWDLIWVAETGQCGDQCMLLDIRDPEYSKNKKLLQITAEPLKAESSAHEPAAGVFLVQAGAKRIAAKEVQADGLTLYRTDYRSSLADGALYQSMLVLPGKQYAAVFTFASANRRDVDEMLAAFPKVFSKSGQ